MTMEPAEGLSSIETEGFSELAQGVAETAQALFNAGSVADTLDTVVNTAVSTIDGCDWAGIFLLDGDVVVTPAHTDPIVMEADSLQHLSGEGPCLDAIAQRLAFYAEDLTIDPRWPGFAALAAEVGIRSVFALPLSSDAHPGALNLYARFPSAFGVVDRAKAVVLSSLASLALSAAYSHEDEERRAADFAAALRTREIIGEALGILMERERISANQAFDILRRASQHLNIKLRDIAQDLVDTGEDPDIGEAPKV
jgi:GAF domain-containing protein